MMPKPFEIAYQLFLHQKHQSSSIIFLASNQTNAAEIAYCLKFFACKNSYFLPDIDIEPYTKLMIDSSVAAERARVLGLIAHNKEPKIVITSIENLFYRYPPEEFFTKHAIELKLGIKISPESIAANLIELGFYKVNTVNTLGEFATRGDILDIMISANQAYRIYFEWDELCCIKLLDVSSQMSLTNVDYIKIFPQAELILNQQTISYFTNNFPIDINNIQETWKYESILKGRKFNGIDNLLAAFFADMQTLAQYLPNMQVYSEVDAANSYQVFIKKCHKNFYLDDFISPISERFLSEQEISELIVGDLQIIKIEECNKNFYVNAKLDTSAAIELLCEFLSANIKFKKVILAFSNLANAENIKHFLEHRNLAYQTIADYTDAKFNTVNIFKSHLPAVIFADSLIITDEQIWGRAKSKSDGKSHRYHENFLLELNNFSDGQLVVHQDYGIAKFDGIQTITIENIIRDYVKLLYANDDKLYVPIENIELIKKFGEGSAELDKLGLPNWQKRKALLKNRISAIAHKLIGTAAARLLHRNSPVVVNQENYQKFRSLFPYVETLDQEKAINEIHNDLISGKLMDRLICADVGYGKTEIAMRAAFFILDNDPTKQVAVVVPTTVLARQHFATFKKRFEVLGFSVAQLSRLVSAKEQKSIKEQIALGNINIIIGTHGLFSEKLAFKNLDLVVIDEEHQFGVKHKEKLKNLKKDAHILALSATPIPRTLQMSLVGIKQLSIIATPPFERMPVKTVINKEDKTIIADAIARELARGGKVFYVAPRLDDLPEVRKLLNSINPDLRIEVAHGGVDANELDNVLERFYDGKFDILLSTNIVQSGLDVPDANTIIIHNADMFGLSQLHQLKGRVGRKKLQGYCYLISKNQQTQSLSYRRLQLIQSSSELGAGFEIASHDIDIRGYGNLLGDEQSGHVKEVGIELYQDMLKAEINKLKQQDTTEQDFSPILSLGVAVHIPDSYIDDQETKLLTYRRIAQLHNQLELENLAAEIQDRFGHMPEELNNLFEIAKLKCQCKKLQISSLDLGPKGLIIKFYQNAHLDIMLKFIQCYPKYSKIRPDGSFFLLKNIEKNAKFEQVAKILNSLESFIYAQKDH